MFGYFSDNVANEIIHQRRQKELNKEILKTKSPVRLCRYPNGYEKYVNTNIKIYKMLKENNVI